MLQEEKDAYDAAVDSMIFALESLGALFTAHGMVGLYKLTNPTFAELKDSLNGMKAAADALCEAIEEKVIQHNDLDAAGASVGLINIRQGILYAENLLMAVQQQDLKKSLAAHSDVVNHGINPNTW